MKITIESGVAYLKEGEKTLALKGKAAAPILQRAHSLIDQIRAKSPHLGQQLPPKDEIVLKVIPRKNSPANVELHYYNPGDHKPHSIQLVDSTKAKDSLEQIALARHALAQRIAHLPNAEVTTSQFESTAAKVLQQSKYIRTATEATEDLVAVDQTIEGAAHIAHRFRGGLRLTAGFGVASAAISTLSAIEDFETLGKHEGSLECRAEVITNLFAHVTRVSAYGTAATIGALELAKGVSRYKHILKVVPILSNIAGILEAFASAIQFHVKRVFFSEIDSRIKLAESGIGGDDIERKAQAIWAYMRSRVTCEEGEIKTKMAQFVSFSESEKIADLTQDYKKSLGWRFFSKVSKKEKVARFQEQLINQLVGLDEPKRSELLNLMKKESIKTRIELAKSHDIKVITSDAVSEQMKIAVSSLNMDLRHHQWAVLGIYSAMESEYKDNRYIEVASIVAGISSRIIGIAAVAVPGGLIIQIFSGALSTANISSLAYLHRHSILMALNLSQHVDLDEQLERILDTAKMRKVRRLA